MFKQYDIVYLTKDFPRYGLKAGVQGTIIECFASPGEEYMVEFSDHTGEAYCTEDFQPGDLSLTWEPQAHKKRTASKAV